jgi:hypothetical protein
LLALDDCLARQLQQLLRVGSCWDQAGVELALDVKDITKIGDELVGRFALEQPTCSNETSLGKADSDKSSRGNTVKCLSLSLKLCEKVGEFGKDIEDATQEEVREILGREQIERRLQEVHDRIEKLNRCVNSFVEILRINRTTVVFGLLDGEGPDSGTCRWREAGGIADRCTS